MIAEELKWAHQYLFALDNETDAKHTRELYRGKLLEFLTSEFEPDEKGSYFWEFDQPLHLGNDSVSGLKAQRRASEYTSEEKALELIDRYNLHDRCINKIIVEQIDLDELFACNQEGIISDEEIEDLIEVEESFSLVRVKG